MHPILNIALRAARKAGDFIIKYYEILNNTKMYLKNDNYFITNLSKTARVIIIETILKSYPQHVILTEEINDYNKSNSKSVQWIINPLNGIENFIKRLPHFSVSIAVRVKNYTEVAVIYDPIRNELFTATRGQGAQLNGYRLRSSNVRDLNNTILATEFPFKTKQYFIKYINILIKLFNKCVNFRHTGSTALDLAYVAAGYVDGYFEVGLKPWELAAGEFIARESGAIVCDFSGGNNYMFTGNIIAGNPQIVKAILDNIREELDENLK